MTNDGKTLADQLEKNIDEHRRRKRHPRGNVEMNETFAVRVLFALRASTTPATIDADVYELAKRMMSRSTRPPVHEARQLAQTVIALSETRTSEPLGWVTMTDKRVSDPVYRTREDAEKDADLLRARGIETKVAGVYLRAPASIQSERAKATDEATAKPARA